MYDAVAMDIGHRTIHAPKGRVQRHEIRRRQLAFPVEIPRIFAIH